MTQEAKIPLNHTHNYFLTAGECNAEGEMPVTLLVSRVIEVATEHANALGIGYAALSPRGIGWVLTRVSVEMARLPGINEEYSLTTWIEGWTRFYSDRCFQVKDGKGAIIGYVRTVWVAIDIEKRNVADLDGVASAAMVDPDMVCPLPRQRKMTPVALNEATNVENYVFRYCDLDFNRHVNSVRYIEHILNLWTPADFAMYRVCRFEIAYIHECMFGETVTIAALVDIAETDSPEISASVDMTRNDERVVSAKVTFCKR